MSDFTDQLDRIAAQYEGRRTVGAEFVRRVHAAAVDHCEWRQAVYDAQLATTIETHQREIERMQRNHEATRSLCMALQAQVDKSRAFNEERKREGADQVKVTIDRSLGGWCVGDLEEIAHRLRIGGALDETPVKLTDYSASATVPLPGLVELERPARIPPPPPQFDPLPDPVVADNERSPRAIDRATATLKLAALALVVQMLTIVYLVVR